MMDGFIQRFADLMSPFESILSAVEASSEAVLFFDDGQLIWCNERARRLLGLSPQPLGSHSTLEDELCRATPEQLRLAGRIVKKSRDGTQAREEVTHQGQRLTLWCPTRGRGPTEVRVSADADPDAAGLPRGNVHTFNHLLTATLGLSELLQDHLKDGSEASVINEQIRRTVSRGLALGQKLIEDPLHSGLSTRVCCPASLVKELAQLLRKSLPPNISVTAELDEPARKYEVQSEELRKLMVLAALEGADDLLVAGGRLTLRLRWPDDGLTLEVISQAREVSGLPRGEGSHRLKRLRLEIEKLGGTMAILASGHQRTLLLTLMPSKENAEETEEAPPNPRYQGRGQKILLVDDDAAIRTACSKALRRLSYEVDCASDGLEALQKFKKAGDYQLVLLDLVMPNLGGSACYEQLRLVDPRVPVILMSGFAANVSVSDMLEAGCLNFIQKPFELLDLVRAVAHAVLN